MSEIVDTAGPIPSAVSVAWRGRPGGMFPGNLRWVGKTEAARIEYRRRRFPAILVDVWTSVFAIVCIILAAFAFFGGVAALAACFTHGCDRVVILGRLADTAAAAGLPSEAWAYMLVVGGYILAGLLALLPRHLWWYPPMEWSLPLASVGVGTTRQSRRCLRLTLTTDALPREGYHPHSRFPFPPKERTTHLLLRGKPDTLEAWEAALIALA